METLTQPYLMKTDEAKRWVSDALGYDVLRMMLSEGELLNKTRPYEYMDNDRLWQQVTFVTVGKGTLVVNHTERTLDWQI